MEMKTKAKLSLQGLFNGASGGGRGLGAVRGDPGTRLLILSGPTNCPSPHFPPFLKPRGES